MSTGVDTERRPSGHRGNATVLAIVALVLLTLTALLPFATGGLGDAGLITVAVSGAIAAVLVLPRVSGGLTNQQDANRRSWWHAAIEMALYLSPVLLLTAVFPFATHRILEVHIGGVSLISLILASSVTVPWLSQAVCLPIYRAIGPLIPEGDMDAIQRRFCQVWASTFVRSLPAVAVFALVMQLVMSWTWSAFGTYLTLSMLHVAFTQSLIVSNVARRRGRWAIAWTCYAAVLFLVPTLWYLPPIVGLVSQLIPLRKYLPYLRQAIRLDAADVAGDLIRGLLLGALLWADKLLLYLKSDGEFDVNAVFLALLPAVFAYNYYFVRLAPHIDRSVMDVRNAMETQPSRIVAQHSGVVSEVVAMSIARTAFIGAVMTLAVAAGVAAYDPAKLSMVTAVSVASFLFMMTTLATYKLDYIGYRMHAQIFGAIHLAMCVVLFLALPIGPLLYVWIALVDLVLFIAALRMCLTEWGSAEYALFWRHATAW